MKRIAMKKILAGIFIGLLVLLPGKEPARAVNCDGTGVFINMNFTPTKLDPTIGSITVGGQFQYKTVSTSQIDCTKESILISYDIVDQAGNTIAHISDRTYDPIGLNDTLTYAAGISHSTVKASVKNDGKVRVRVTASHLITSGADALATTFGEFNFVTKVDAAFGCIADDGKYACGTMSDCSDAAACKGKACIQISDNRVCGTKPNTTNPGNPTNPTGPGAPTTPTGPGGTSVRYNFNIPNPLKADDLMGLINSIATWIFNLSIPVAVIIITWAGLRFLFARGDAGEVSKAKEMLWYAVVGLTIIFVGKGFISLIQSIINLGAK
jgi:hypothetical protein